MQPTNIAEDIVKWDSHFGKIAWQFFKMLSIELSYDLAIPFSGIYPRERKAYIHTNIHSSFIFSCPKLDTS